MLSVAARSSPSPGSRRHCGDCFQASERLAERRSLQPGAPPTRPPEGYRMSPSKSNPAILDRFVVLARRGVGVVDRQ